MAYEEKQRSACEKQAIFMKTPKEPAKFDPAEFGFEFSIPQIEQHLDAVMRRIAIRQHIYLSPKKAA